MPSPWAIVIEPSRIHTLQTALLAVAFVLRFPPLTPDTEFTLEAFSGPARVVRHEEETLA